jgi:hypothetical protein
VLLSCRQFSLLIRVPFGLSSPGAGHRCLRPQGAAVLLHTFSKGAGGGERRQRRAFRSATIVSVRGLRKRYTGGLEAILRTRAMFVPAALQVRLGQTSIVGYLEWLRHRWLTASAIGVGVGFAGLIVNILSLRRSGSPERQARERANVLERLGKGWIRVLDESLEGTEPLVLSRRRRPELIDDQGAAIPFLAFRSPSFPEEKSILEIFDGAGGKLLILGEPGAGKTILLLQLAKELAHRADRDREQPVPVVINLSSWADGQRSLSKWIARQLATRYKITRKTAGRWIGEDSAVLLLDGLDEVSEYHRDTLVKAINKFQREHDLVKVAVCCRTRQAMDLAGRHVRLQLAEAIELEPPTDGQIRDYMDHLESTGVHVADIRAALATDQELNALLRSPLMLNAIRFGYSELAGNPNGPESSREWSERLWDAYIRGIFGQKLLEGYAPEQAIRWLGWLAWAMREHGRTEFRPEILTEQWLPSRHRKPRGIPERTLLFIAADRRQPYAELRDAWKFQVSRRRPTTNIALASGLIAGLITAAIVFNVLRIHWSRGALGLALSYIPKLLTVGYITLLCFTVFAVLVPLVFIDGLEVNQAGTNEDLMASARLYGPGRGLLHGIVSGFLITLTFGLYVGIPGTIFVWAYFEYTVFITALVAYSARDGLRPFAAQVLLARAGKAPLRYSAFLKEMSERRLLMHTGNDYFFAHYLLRDYLADQTSDGTRRPTSAQTSH